MKNFKENIMSDRNLKLAIQKNGRLTEKSIELLRFCGLAIENYSERLIVTANNFKLDLLFLRDDDIPEYVQDGVADIGIVGKDVVIEKGVDVKTIFKLGFGKCDIVIATPENIDVNSAKDLKGKVIATSFPNILKSYLKAHDIRAKIIELSGSVEIAPSLGEADIICDIVSTGNTLKLNKLKKSIEIFKAEAILIGTKKQLPGEIKILLNDLIRRIRSALTARSSKYLMMNIPKTSLENIVKAIPSLKSPTVLPLADKDMLAIHAVIPSDSFWGMIDDLKALGASGILLLPIENMIS
jgi:ATP phosphoribosyltransferase